MHFILLCEGFILLAAGIFYWYPSNFPADSPATGIDSTEWRWLFGLLLATLAIVAVFFIQRSEYPTPWRIVLSAGALLVAAAAMLSVWPYAHSPLNVDRADWFWLLVGFIPLMLLNAWLNRRLWTVTPLDLFMLALVVLCIISASHAPYTSRGLRMLIRPLYGMALIVFFIEWTRYTGTLRGPLIVAALLGILLGLIGLGATQWTTKSVDFQPVLDALPEWQPFFLGGGINPNEIAGMMTLLIPITAIMTRYPIGIPGRILGGTAFTLMSAAMFLGQSRAAIAGVIVSLGIITLLSVSRRWRYMILGAVAMVAVVQGVILFNLLPSDGGEETVGLNERDQATSGQRLDIWDSAIDIISTYPLTGVGMNRFRYGPVARDFPIVGWDIPDPDNPDSFRRRRPPHAHNALIQIGTDLGIPGMLAFIGLLTAATFMTWVSWRNTTGIERTLSLALLAGIVAHMIYGLGDAIPIWDRGAFLFWLVLGLIAAQYCRWRNNPVAN